MSGEGTGRSRAGAPAILALLSVMLAGEASAQAVAFAPKTDFTTGLSPQTVAVGDLNGDGKLDLAVSNYSTSSNSLSVLLGNGAGGFGAKTDFSTGAGSQPASVAIGDVNGDGKPDLMSSNWSTNNISVFLGDGVGGFGTKTDFATGGRTISGKLVDLNGDNKLDAVVANWSTGKVEVLLGNGTGGFGAHTDFSAGTGAYSLALGDLNGDGKLDVAVGYLNPGSTTVSVLLGNGLGAFGAAVNFTSGTGPVGVALGDLNGDGKLDLAVSNLESNTVSVLIGNGLGSLAAKTDFTVGSSPLSVVIGDFNGDGKPDLAAANSNAASTTISVLLGSGTGGFAPKSDFTVGTAPARMASGDLNADGRLDLAVPNGGTGNVSVLLNATLDDPPALVLTWGTFGSGNGQFKRPTAVDFDSQGNVYVLDSGNYRIQKFDRNGGFLAAFGSHGSSDGQFDWPCATYNTTKSNTKNECFAVDDRGAGDVHVFVSDEFNHRIQEFDGGGVFLRKWGACGSANGQFGGPLGIVADDPHMGGASAIRIYATDTGNSRIQKFGADGTYLGSMGSYGAGDGQLNVAGDPIPGVDVSLEQIPGAIWFADAGNHRIQKLDKSGTFLTKWGSCGQGDGEFDGPLGLLVDDKSAAIRVYVTDGGSRIQQFDGNGGFIKSWGSYGAGDGQFGGPPGVTVDDKNAVTRLYAVDQGNYRIQEFNTSGTFLTKWGSRGTGPGQFGESFIVAVGPSALTGYCSGTGGAGCIDLGCSGTCRGGLNPSDPCECVVSSSFYVVDTNNNRIQKFGVLPTVGVERPTDPSPMKLSLLAFPNPSTGEIQIAFTLPTTSSANLEVYDLTGRVIWKAAPPSPGANTVHWPGIDQDGTHVRSGMYFVRLRTAQEERTTSVMLVK